MYTTLLYIKLLKRQVQGIDIRQRHIVDISSVILTQFDGQLSFFGTVMESADFCFIATQFVAVNSFIFVWMVQSLNCSVAFVTFQALRTLVPRHAF